MKDDNLSRIIELRHELHRHPELSLNERETKRILMEFIKKNTKGISLTDKETYFYCCRKSQNPLKRPILFRADFDAVAINESCQLDYLSENPGIGHKCGHDGHSATLCGLILETMDKEYDRDIYYLFQHGEEIGAGGKECASLIKEKGIEMAFAFHNRSEFPEGALVYRRGLTQCASKGLTIKFLGSEAHASQPENGKNPAFAIGEIIHSLNDLLLGCDFKEMVLATIIDVRVGDRNFGVAPGYGEISFTLRANREDELLQIDRELRTLADTLSIKYGLKVCFTESDPFPETRNTDRGIDEVIRVAKEMSLELIEMEEPWRASEDFGYYLKECDGAMFYVGNGLSYPNVHTPEYDFNDRIIPVVTEIFERLI